MEIQSLRTKQRILSEKLPKGGVWILGFFDGVHIGHRKLLETALSCGEKQRKTTGIPTFAGVWTFASLSKATDLLTTPEERADLFSEYGISWLATEQFSAVSAWSGKFFFTEYLLPYLSPSALVCGFNFRFGAGRESGAEELLQWGRAAGVEVRVVSPCEMEGRTVSSTWIRTLVREGCMEEAASLLARPYTVTGIVEHGKALGRKLGFPTANLRLPKEKAIPGAGVYATKVLLPETGEQYEGVTNIGSRPTVDGDYADITVETWIRDYTGDLYGKYMTLAFYGKIRNERKFPDLESLRVQVEKDKAAAACYFAGKK